MADPRFQHPDYKASLNRWAMCRDVLDGEEAVHLAGAKYLPALTGQSGDEYRAYVQRTPFYNATARTVDGFVGMIFRKDPVVDAPAALDEIRADVTLTGSTLEEVSERIARAVIGFGRAGVLVEFPLAIEGPMTLAQAKAQNLRPYATLYGAEHILNWRTERIANAQVLTMVVLQETVTEWVDEYEARQVSQLRALHLEDGRYLQRVYRESSAKAWEMFGGEIVPLMNGAPLAEIPFLIFGPMKNEPEVQKPPILDLVTLNLSHYRSTADLEHGAHFTGLPQPWISGYSPAEGEVITIGSSQAWVFPDPNSQAGYLEFTGQGLQALADRCKAKEEGMAAIGARMLAPEKEGVEAAQTLKLRQAGERAVLATIAKMVSAGLTRVLQTMAQWEGIDDEVSVELNTDFVPVGLGAQDLTALVAAWQSGAISEETLFWNLKWGEIIPEERSFEDEQAKIAAAGPTLQQQAALIPPAPPGQQLPRAAA